MEDNKWRERKYLALKILVVMLFLSNVFFFSEYRRIEENNFYSLHSWINIAAYESSMHENSRLLLNDITSIKDQEYLRKILNEINTMGDGTYQIEDYRVLKYKNGNTLMLKLTENRQGKFLIQDMFFLDESIFERLKYTNIEDRSN